MAYSPNYTKNMTSLLVPCLIFHTVNIHVIHMGKYQNGCYHSYFVRSESY